MLACNVTRNTNVTNEAQKEHSMYGTNQETFQLCPINHQMQIDKLQECTVANENDQNVPNDLRQLRRCPLVAKMSSNRRPTCSLDH